MKKSYETHIHEFLPAYSDDSELLILGSFPSVKSREQGFYYGHPNNRFWKIIAEICREKLPQSIEEKKEILLRNKIALWDVIEKCDIIGSSDSSIKNVVPNDISRLLSETNIKKIYVNGKKAEQLYNKYVFNKTRVAAIVLPSTSPANAAWSYEKLAEEWKRLIEI